ncbi:MAG: hypothetical protein ABIP97_10270 [Chthoniobacterales bacterium]
MNRIVISIVILFIFGGLRTPYEIALQKSEKAARFKTEALTLNLRERIGQTSFLAALSGFRSLVAAFLWIDAHNAWERTEWGRMAGIFDTVTTLQPHSVLYWDMSAWHMAWNASSAVKDDKKQTNPLLRERTIRQYYDLGKSFLERGIQNNPEQYYLYERLADLERDKYEDHCAAAAAFAKAAEFPQAPPYVKRFAAYELAECPGKEREAYAKLREIFDEGQLQHLPTLLKKLRDMEKKLDIPENQRIQIPDAPAEKK